MSKVQRTLAALSLMFLFCTGCEPFENAEKIFHLPDEVWDKAVSVKGFRAFEIKNISDVQFIQLKALLLTDGCTEHKLDFNFSPVEQGKPMTVKSTGAVLLMKAPQPGEQERRAAVYIESEKRLLLGVGTPEK
ncbi:MAG: hypothetical protein IJW08_00070 [Lentisphaeria bacterium]|nr:hypothetical protein [Lentisphaeria bacterium]